MRANLEAVFHDREYMLGRRQIALWKRRGERLPKCKFCGRLIDGEMKRGYCVWCASTEPNVMKEIAQIKSRIDRERKKAKAAAKLAERNANRMKSTN